MQKLMHMRQKEHLELHDKDCTHEYSICVRNKVRESNDTNAHKAC